MINKLSVKNYFEQKTDKKACAEIAKTICAAVKRAWEKGEFSTGSVTSQTGDLTGYRINFNIQTDIPNDTVYKDTDEGTINAITSKGTYKYIDINLIHQYNILHNIDWKIVSKYFFKYLKDYLDLSYVKVITSENRAKKPELNYFFAESQLISPENYQGNIPMIGVSLVIITNKDMARYVKNMDKE